MASPPFGAERGRAQLLIRCNGNFSVIDCRGQFAAQRDPATKTNFGANRDPGNRVRTRLSAGGSRIRTFGPPQDATGSLRADRDRLSARPANCERTVGLLVRIRLPPAESPCLWGFRPCTARETSPLLHHFCFKGVPRSQVDGLPGPQRAGAGAGGERQRVHSAYPGR